EALMLGALVAPDLVEVAAAFAVPPGAHLPAKLLPGFPEVHFVSAFGGDAGGLESGGSAPGDEHPEPFRRLRCRLWPLDLFPSRRIHHAGDWLVRFDVLVAAVAGDARHDLGLTVLQRLLH